MTLPDNTIHPAPWTPEDARADAAASIYSATRYSPTLAPTFTADDAAFLAYCAIARLRRRAIADILRHCLTRNLMTPAAAALILTTLDDPDAHTTALTLDGSTQDEHRKPLPDNTTRDDTTKGPDMATNRPNPDADLVTVCDACLRASCWRGAFHCDNYVRAGTVRLKHATLERLGLEAPDYRITDAEYLNR